MGSFDSETTEVTVYPNVNWLGKGEKVNFVDVPGLCDTKDRD